KANVEFLTEQIYDLLDGQSITVPKGIELPRQQLEKLTGFYEAQGSSEVIYTYLVDDELNVNFQGRDQGSLVAKSETEFFQPESDASVQFQFAEDGQCTGMHVQQRGMTIEANKYDGPWGIRDSMIAELQSVLKQEPEHTENWHEAAFQLLPILAFNEDLDRYRTLSAEVLKFHGDTKDPQIAERSVKVLLLAPDAKSLEAVGAIADRFYQDRDKMGTFNWGGEVAWSGYLSLVKGMADCRQGNYEAALEALGLATEFSSQDPHSILLRDLFLAMVYHRSGRQEEAAATYARVEKRIENLPANYAYGMGHDRILVHLAQQDTLQSLGRTASDAADSESASE
ncbi:MAG: DUF3471 domain-containing protein, partial [Planctomycetota bacterium]